MAARSGKAGGSGGRGRGGAAGGSPREPLVRLIAENRRARHEFEILDEQECGIVLKGTEVKSLRAGQASLAESWGQVRDGELWLMNSTIPAYGHGNIHNHEPARERKLLLQRREIARWHAQVKIKGVTLVPLALYFKGALVKVTLALCKGRKLHDKRERTKEREAARDIERATQRRR